jgi:hypothetical protein
MDRPTFVWSFKRSQVYEVGAALLVLLAYPNEKSETRSDELHASLCARALWSRYLSNREDTTPITVRPQHVFREIKLFNRECHFIVRRFRDRLVAGRVMIAFLQRAELGRGMKQPPGIRRLSINQMAGFVQKDAGQADIANVKSRVWAPSRSVIHLAAAVATVGQELTKAESPGIDLFLERRDLIEEVVRRAQLYEGLIENDPTMPVKIEKLIKVRLA